MIGDDAVGDAGGPVGVRARGLGAGQDQRAHDVDVVVVVLALQDRSHALQPHAGVDRGPRQRVAHAGRTFLELHEHEVPDLDEAVAILIRAAGGTAGDVGAVVVEDLGAGTAGAGIAHAPEIVGGGDADDAVVGQASNVVPEGGGVVVFRENGHQQPVLRQAVVAGDEGPGQFDGERLEVIAEAEITQHLEEGVVSGGVADVVQVVVLAAGADAFLGGRGAVVGTLLRPGEDVLELDHARIGEEQGGVVARDERGGFHDGVTVAGEKAQEIGADVVGARHEFAAVT